MNILYEALRKEGIPPPLKNTETYRIVRWGHNNRYWLKKFDGGYVFGDFVDGLSKHVFEKAYKGQMLTEAQSRMQQARKEAEIDQAKAHEKASVKAMEIWSQATPMLNHPYLVKKKVQSHGLKSDNDGKIIIPAYDESGKIWTLQYVFETVNKDEQKEFIKRFMPGGRKKGNFFVIGDIASSDQLYICEGYATGASIYECTNIPVVVAFDTSNLQIVAEKICNKYRDAKIVICADNDQFHDSGVNAGLDAAKEAARAIGASVVKPEFRDLCKKPTDFNDLLREEGTEAVKSSLGKLEKLELSDFELTNEGLFYISGRTGKKIRISNYISVQAFVKEKSGNISRLVEFKDYQNRA